MNSLFNYCTVPRCLDTLTSNHSTRCHASAWLGRLLLYCYHDFALAQMTEQSSELAQLWEQAVDEYLSKSKRVPVAQRWKLPITTQADLNNLIEQHDSDFARFRSSREKFWDVLMATEGRLQNLGNVAQADIKLSICASSRCP